MTNYDSGAAHSASLRSAAAILRDRAGAADDRREFARGVAKMGRLTPKGRYMEAMTPAVGLAVASLLDICAQAQEASPEAPATQKEIAAFIVAELVLNATA